jgi:hypothetical protein
MSCRTHYAHARGDLKKCGNRDCENTRAGVGGFLSIDEFSHDASREDEISPCCKVCSRARQLLIRENRRTLT